MLLVDSPARLCLNRRSRGDIAQLIERSIRIAEVEGLNPSISTRCYYFISFIVSYVESYHAKQ